MRSIQRLFREITLTFATIIFFNSFLNSLIIFLLCYLLLSIPRVNGAFAFIPAGLFFIFSIYKQLTKRHVLDIEKKFSFLNEELRTIQDNMNMDNPVMKELQMDVMDKIKNVDIGSFFNSKGTSLKVLTVVFLCFGLLFVATKNMTFDFKTLVDTMPNYVYVGGGNTGGGNSTSGNVRVAGQGTNEDILGEQDVAALGDQNVDIQIAPAGYEINLRDVAAPQKRYFQDLYPTDICVSDSACRQSETYNDQMTKDESEIVKNYFLKITS
jgi:hypothetical protein